MSAVALGGLQQQWLEEFYLFVFYDEAVIYSTTYEAPGFGFLQIAAFIRRELAAKPDYP